MSTERQRFIEQLRNAGDITEEEASIVLDNFLEVLLEAQKAKRDVMLVGFKKKPFKVPTSELDLSVLVES